MTARVLRFPVQPISSEEGRAAAQAALSTPLPERRARAEELHLEDPETLLGICGHLRQQLDSVPLIVLSEAAFFYGFLDQPRRSIGLLDEREYFLGETALLAGAACRGLSRREEARRWYDRSEGWFRQTVNSAAAWARLGYQRLALRTEERQFEEVLELLPSLIESFETLEMDEDALKCRFLEGLVLMETDQVSDAIAVFDSICERAAALPSDPLFASACGNLTQLHAGLGDTEKALAACSRAVPILRRLDNRVALAKVQWGMGDLMRVTGRASGALEAYRAAQKDFAAIGMRADVTALQLVVADLLLDAGQDEQAREEILAALPVIDEIRLVPEGMAALTLLRESVRGRRIDREALRELHGYFDRAQG